MLTDISGAVRNVSGTLLAAVHPIRLLALLPACLLGAFWLAGETALIGAALLAPILVLVPGFLRKRDEQGGTNVGQIHLKTRDELEAWLAERMAEASGPRNGQVAVLTLVIDDLEALESRFGRETRQSVRCDLAYRLGTMMRKGDALATLDDNILALALPNVQPPESENLLRMARRLQSICDEPFKQNTTRVYCTMSVGIAFEDQVSDATPLQMISAAERAGDFAASSGAGSVRLFSEGLLSKQEEERKCVQILSNALETSEIFAWFQPQLSSDGQRLIGFEALARWDRDEKGVVQPGQFLPDIQRIGLSQRLTEVVLKQALTALNAWDAAGHKVPRVSVNFSGDELRNPRLADYVMWELDRFDLAPDRLVVEVLESVVADRHEDSVSRTLLALSRAGCQIDLDDFGTGFTSILNIRRFNVSRIKIDRQLIARLDKDQDQRRMVSALLSFSQKLGIEALAEGVETGTECEVLRQLGCSLIQGYVVAKPMPLGETLLWLDRFEERAGAFSDIPKVKTA